MLGVLRALLVPAKINFAEYTTLIMISLPQSWVRTATWYHIPGPGQNVNKVMGFYFRKSCTGVRSLHTPALTTGLVPGVWWSARICVTGLYSWTGLQGPLVQLHGG